MERRAVSHRLVFGALAVTLVVGFVLALFIHDRFARYEPRAPVHLPDEVRYVARLDVEPTLGYEAFERHVLPLLETGRTGPEPRIKHLERKTSIDLAVDCREFVYAELGKRDWLLLAAGHFRHDPDVVDGVFRMAQDLYLRPRKSEDGWVVIFGNGVSFTVSEDGTLILSSEPELARAARTPDRAGAFKPLLLKPGALLSLVSYESVLGEERFWTSVQPGDSFPTYFEVVSEAGGPSGRELARAQFGLELGGTGRRDETPIGVQAETFLLSERQVDRLAEGLSFRIGEHLRSSFGGRAFE